MNKRLQIVLFIGILIVSCATVAYLIYSFRTSPSHLADFTPHTESDEIRIRATVEEINRRNLTWKAEYNPLATISGTTEEDSPNLSSLKIEGLTLDESIRKRLVADTESNFDELINFALANRDNITLPDSFDAREGWPNCPSLQHIRNQGGCGSCWAAAATSMIADRLCISSNFTIQSMPSMEDLASCCEFCGGCQGSRYSILSLLHLNMTGVVTGGDYGSNDGCRPYSIDSTCGAPCPLSFMTSDRTPKCQKKCQSGFNRDYDADLIKTRSVYWLAMSEHYEYSDYTEDAYHTLKNKTKGYRTSELLMLDILLHGPVMLSVVVNESFMHYKSGIYLDPHIETNEILTYGHSMKVLGWGKEAGQRYLLVANSWGREWGENGFGRIAFRGFEHLDIVAASV